MSSMRASSDALLQLAVDQPAVGTTLVTVAGEVDAATAPQLADVLRPHLTAHVTVVVDLSGVTFLGTVGLSVLVDAHRTTRDTGGMLKLIIGSHCVKRTLEITGLAAEFACFPDRAAALAA